MSGPPDAGPGRSAAARTAPSANRLLTVDLDETLWPLRETMLRAMRETAKWVSAHSQPAAKILGDMEAMMRIRKELVAASPDLRSDLGRLRQLSMERGFAEAGLSPGAASELAQGAFDVFYPLRQQVTPFPKAPPALRDLGRDHVLGTLTNGNADAARMPVGGLFRFHYRAGQQVAGRFVPAKPEPAMFHAALEETGIAAAAAIHLGDDPETDVEGARRAGYAAAVWFNAAGADWPLDTPAPPQAACWSEVPALLRSLDLPAAGPTLGA